MELSNYVSKLLRDNFGKGPEAVYVSMGYTFITLYIRNFITPTERVLMQQNNEEFLQEMRGAVISTLIPEIKAYIRLITGMDLQEFYYDWNLHNKSGMLVGISNDQTRCSFPLTEDYKGKNELHQELTQITADVQKAPEELFSYQLNPRTILAIRNGIFVRIEKELIRQGMQESLRIAKRKLEKRVLHNNIYFQRILQTKVMDIFVDWDFDLDKGVILFILSENIKSIR
ncbi:DUF2294 family protein [Salinibacillus xinjiangensis]|uniref:DUF2294 family protein n=2 Tax=Salinibacillus xinjiangensis TaxID=1229268 RepID=A0A6G1X7K2_9BACI|nr:DUF2294 family protein [Salinibacillus xinjiangensis]